MVLHVVPLGIEKFLSRERESKSCEVIFAISWFFPEMCKKMTSFGVIYVNILKNPIKRNGRVFTCLEILEKWEALRAGNLKEGYSVEWIFLFNCRLNCSGDLSLGTNTDLKDIENYLLYHFSCSSVFTLRKTKLP